MAVRKLSDKELEDKLIEFENVIKARENLPLNIDRVLLLRFLKFYNGNVEKALKRLLASFELRKSYPNIFYNRDVFNPILRKLIDQVEMVLLPRLTNENNRVLLLRLIDYDPESVCFDDALTVFTMVYDTSVITPEPDVLADGEIVIFDLKGLTGRHLSKLSLSSLRCFFKYMIDAHPLKTKQVHIINSHSLLDKLKLLMKPFLGSKAMKVFNFHLPNSTTLYDFVPRDVLPDEFGGTAGSIEEPKCFWIKRTQDHRDYLLDDTRWKVREEKLNEDSTIEEALNYLGFC